MTDLRALLERLDLAEYANTFIEEGFDSWQTLTDITESDLNDLGVKLGHRRKLQRAIAESKGQSSAAQSPVIESMRHEGSPDTSSPVGGQNHGSSSPTSSGGALRTKRKYRRHPKPDVNAPERPASAYVRFSNRMRQELADQDLSFIEMAKVVGDRWQGLPSQEREWYEGQAAADKEKYNTDLSRYKRTEDYARYQQYLVDFKAKANGNHASSDGKRAKHVGDDSVAYSSHSIRRGSSASEPYSIDTVNSINNLNNSISARYAPVSPRSSSQHSSTANVHPSRRHSPATALPNRSSALSSTIYDYARLPQAGSMSTSGNYTPGTSHPVPDIKAMPGGSNGSNSSFSTSGSISRSTSSKSPTSQSLPSLSSMSSVSDRSSYFGTPSDVSSRALPPLHVATAGNNTEKYHDSVRYVPEDVELNPRHTGALAALLRAGEVLSARDSEGAAVNYGKRQAL